MIILTGTFSFIIAVAISILVVYSTYRFFSRLSRASEGNDLTHGNVAAAITVVGDLIAFGILMSHCLYPVSAVIQNLFIQDGVTTSGVFKTLGLIGAYVVIAYILSVFTVSASAWVFQRLTTGIDELALIKKNNIAVAVILAGIVITVAIMVQSGLSDALNVLIPQPGTGGIHVR
jgi:uncharacterized membrane protein YjfL (UPF0719 family)